MAVKEIDEAEYNNLVALRGVASKIVANPTARRLLEQAQKLGLEGLIGKKADSVYEVGRRSGSWIKLKITLPRLPTSPLF